MTRPRHLFQALTRRWRSEDGAVTVEFVIVFPFVLSLMLMSIDAGITQLRQTFLHRAVDLAVREVRLGRVNESEAMSALICARTSMLPSCLQNITVEMQVIDTQTFAGLDQPTFCVDREENITPAVDFNPGSRGEVQDLMLVRVCVAADPFVRLTGVLTQMALNDQGQYVITSNAVFVNEPE